MAIIATADLYTLLYPEVVDEITRQDSALAKTAISAAIDEVSIYLSKYDTVALLGDADNDPSFASPLLKKYCVAIACWNLVGLANPSINYEHIKANYEKTVAQLLTIQKGTVNPPNWPYKDTAGQTAPQGSSVSGTWYPKRNNSF